MSRILRKVNDRFSIIHGTDHVLGYFVQVTDNQLAGTKDDPQGEGYVFDWDSLFGTNLSKLPSLLENQTLQFEHSANPTEVTKKLREVLKNEKLELFKKKEVKP